MPAQPVILIAAGGLFLAGAACSDDERPAATPDQAAGRGGTGGASSSSGGEPNGDGGVAGTEADGGAGGEAGSSWGLCGTLPSGPCSDGVLHCEEECDGDVFFLESCYDYGFETGSLACRDDCTVDTSDCSGTERCDDSRDNDGDGQVDCVDSDCADQCQSPCDSPVVLDDPGSASGSTVSQGNATDPSCVISGSGPEMVYQVTVASTGLLDVTLETYSCLVVSARTDCANPATELDCAVGAIPDEASDPTISVPVTAGDTIYVVVDGCDPTFADEFDVSVSSGA